MKKIAKSITFATKYKAWLDKKENSNLSHGVYTSSNGTYYHDVLYELLICQEGLCAYTEHKLLDLEQIELLKSCFTDGKYNEKKYKAEIPVELEHFDATLKDTKCWLWSNLFAVFKVINGSTVKGTKPVDTILKPDIAEYEPSKLLTYKKKEHKFFPNPDLSFDEAKKVDEMIKTLGLNYGYVVTLRKDYLENVLIQHANNTPQTVYQFFTAFEMCKSELAPQK
jgi:hypothetical protein